MINNLRYADDTVIIAESKNQLQQLMDAVEEENEAKGLFLNSAKSFTMVFSKFEVRHICKITVHGNTLEQVDRLVYLGSQFTHIHNISVHAHNSSTNNESTHRNWMW